MDPERRLNMSTARTSTQLLSSLGDRRAKLDMHGALRSQVCLLEEVCMGSEAKPPHSAKRFQFLSWFATINRSAVLHGGL